MLSDRESKLKIYSLGIVVKDKERESMEISVSPIEELPHLEEKIVDFKPKYRVVMPDVNKVSQTANIEGQGYITAQWLPLSQTNRYTAPDVIANETVIIYRYADMEQYYWDTNFIEPHIRRLETVRHMFGNLQARLVKWDKSSSYWTEVSTHDKHVKLKTTTSDGEDHEYDIILNTGKSTFEIHDDIDNILKLWSNDHRWYIQNATKSYIDIVKNIIYQYAERLICIRSNHIHLNTNKITISKGRCGDYENSCGGSVSLDSGSPVVSARLMSVTAANDPPIIEFDDEGNPIPPAPGSAEDRDAAIADSLASASSGNKAYHQSPFVHTCEDEMHAEIGNAYSAYSHYVGPNIINLASENRTSTIGLNDTYMVGVNFNVTAGAAINLSAPIVTWSSILVGPLLSAGVVKAGTVNAGTVNAGVITLGGVDLEARLAAIEAKL